MDVQTVKQAVGQEQDYLVGRLTNRNLCAGRAPSMARLGQDRPALENAITRLKLNRYQVDFSRHPLIGGEPCTGRCGESAI